MSLDGMEIDSRLPPCILCTLLATQNDRDISKSHRRSNSSHGFSIFFTFLSFFTLDFGPTSGDEGGLGEELVGGKGEGGKVGR